VAKLETGHTPSKRNPSYWGGSIPWVSLHDTEGLDTWEIQTTRQTITEAGLANSSARLLPKGTVVFSRTATVGKATVMGNAMATSQDFACYVCGPAVHNFFLAILLRSMRAEWKKLMAGSIHNTVYMPVFKTLSVDLPPFEEQVAIAATLFGVEQQIKSLEVLITKKRQIKQGAMQELLTGKRRMPGFSKNWSEVRLASIGRTYGGLTGKCKADFGHGSGRYITFMNVMANVTMDPELLENVDIALTESQNRVQPGDLLFNGSSETPEEVAFCSWVKACGEDVYLNSFCFGFRFNDPKSICGLFMAYFFRASPGRRTVSALAQGATRYNISKTALLQAPLLLPEIEEQNAIATVLSEMDADIAAIEARLTKACHLKQAIEHALLTGRIRLIDAHV
jgi:type I restriction enzyme S subunit